MKEVINVELRAFISDKGNYVSGIIHSKYWDQTQRLPLELRCRASFSTYLILTYPQYLSYCN